MHSSNTEESTSADTPLDPTFRNYDAKQATAYAEHRGSAYKPGIIREVIASHTKRGGGFDSVFDVGCGTGQATKPLAAFFERAAGCDPSMEMVARAAQGGGKTKSGRDISFEVLDAERLDESTIVQARSVDLLIAAMAAHWFRMGHFWAQAARMVKPGGTVALWTLSSLYCHPSTPNAAAVQKALSHLEDDILSPYELPQNRLSRDLYANLGLPWTVDPSAATAFPEVSFVRLEWNRDGKLEPNEDDFFNGSDFASLDELAEALGTASMVTCWREAHPELAGTDQDCVAKTMRTTAEAMGDKRDLSKIRLRCGNATTLLLFTRSCTTDGYGNSLSVP